jgi:hypothetical protein
MKAKFFLMLLLLSLCAPRLGAQDVPSDAKKHLQTAWLNKPGLCLTALRLLVMNSAQLGATVEPTDGARADALDALDVAGFKDHRPLLNEAFKNPNFRDWLATVPMADPEKPDSPKKNTPLEIESNAQELVDCIYGQDDGITKLGDVTRAKAAHPDSKDLVPLLSLLDAVSLEPTPDPPAAKPPAICHDSYANRLDAFRAAYALKSAKWSIFDYIAEKINGSPSK